MPEPATLPAMTLPEIAAAVRARPELLADAWEEMRLRGTDVETPRRRPAQQALLETP